MIIWLEITLEINEIQMSEYLAMFIFVTVKLFADAFVFMSEFRFSNICAAFTVNWYNYKLVVFVIPNLSLNYPFVNHIFSFSESFQTIARYSFGVRKLICEYNKGIKLNNFVCYLRKYSVRTVATLKWSVMKAFFE